MQGHKPFFHVIEFWLENRLTIEVVSPAMAREYEDRVKGAQPSNDEATPALRRTRPCRSGRIRAKGGREGGTLPKPLIERPHLHQKQAAVARIAAGCARLRGVLQDTGGLADRQSGTAAPQHSRPELTAMR